ncbi:MAG: hypothetical protein HRU78_07965 [Gammaproteobacteria bacterium]|nr:MAG: hypothetical protein HRU78_07965 [Gammaproteobacteria bacterium]
MKIKEYIEKGEKLAGKQAELARILGVRDSYLRQAKLGKSGLPDAICIKLARYIGESEIKVVAASNLVTEKDEERRKVFESCFSITKAASFIVAALFIALISITTPNPANASQARESIAEQFVLC